MDKRIKAVGTLSLFNTGDVRRNGYMRTQMGNIMERQREASLARQKEAALAATTSASGLKKPIIGEVEMSEMAGTMAVIAFSRGSFTPATDI